MDSGQITNSRAQKYGKTNKKSSDDNNKKPSKTNSKRRYSTTVIVFSIIIIFIVGTMIGYGLIGGGNALDLFRLETWSHLYKLVFG